MKLKNEKTGDSGTRFVGGSGRVGGIGPQGCASRGASERDKAKEVGSRCCGS